MDLQTSIIVGAIGASVAFGLGWQVNGWRLGEQLQEARLSYESERVKAAKKTAEAENAARMLERERTAKTNAIAAEAEARREAREASARTITERIVEYVDRPIERCSLDAEWVRIHDAAAIGPGADNVSAATDAATESDDSAGTVKASQSLLVVTSNYAACNGYRDELIAWQEWARSLGQESEMPSL